MSTVFGSVWWFLVTLGVLVTFHEFGHFWVARRCGVRVLKFSVGFGKALWSRTGRDGVVYQVAAIPLGGYVKFLDAREADDPAYVEGQKGEYNAAPVWKRMAIAAAGPAFNVVFTVIACWAMLVIGKPDFPAVLGTPEGIAAQSGFAQGDRIVAVDGAEIKSMTPVMLGVGQDALEHKDAAIDVIDAQGQAQRRTLKLSSLPADASGDAKLVKAIGLAMPPAPAIIGQVTGGPAARAGVQVGDRVLRINDTPIANWDDLPKAIQAEAAKNAELKFQVERDGAPQTLMVKAERDDNGSAPHWIVGIGIRDPRTAVERYGPFAAVPQALIETRNLAGQTLTLLVKMFSGEVSIKNVRSVVTIAEEANFSAQMGVAWFLAFLAQISMVLAILNLLPIPILDGGHLVYYLIELVKGKPLSERAMIAGQYVGLALLLTLMSVAFYNDIVAHFAG